MVKSKMLTSKKILKALESIGADPSTRGDLAGYGSWLPAARNDLDPLVIKKKNRELLLAMYKDQKIKNTFINAFKSIKGVSIIPSRNMTMLTLVKDYPKSFAPGLFNRYIKGSQGRYKLSSLGKVVTQADCRLVVPPLKLNTNLAFPAYVYLKIEEVDDYTEDRPREKLILSIVLSLQDILESESVTIKTSKPLTTTEVFNFKVTPIRKMAENAIRSVDAIVSEIYALEAKELKLDFKKFQLNQFVTNRVPTD